MSERPTDIPPGIAIIGMQARFPGAADVETFWKNLCDGVESVSFFSEEELRAAGVDVARMNDPDYVRAAAVLEGIDRFDAAFFDISPAEARRLDPQHRLFLELAWEALERAGHAPSSIPGPVGVFAGAAGNHYAHNYLIGDGEGRHITDLHDVVMGSDGDFLPTRIAYKLDLHGPAVNVQTACSTSLMAVHLACQSLESGECDLALAGGVSVMTPQKVGYLHKPGMILSPDGHCRPFDAVGEGIVGGNGAGVVVLRRLDEALADGDAILAVIRGSASNNDGARKAGFTAPSVDGQAEVIAEALAVAGVTPADIGYIEAHGTGTPIGDPIEIMALNRVFTGLPAASRAIGSVKGNFGHLNTAAGIAGLLKTVLMLQHERIPPSLHFKRPNPKIDFAAGPFYVADRLQPWPETPRRAGVSSFGIGGTNVHVVLEKAPPPQPRPAIAETVYPLPLSAKTLPALQLQAQNLARWLNTHPRVDLRDVAFTLARGREPFAHRRVVVARSVEEAVRLLTMAADDRSPAIDVDEPVRQLLELGRSWEAGADIDWRPLFDGPRPQRLPLPAHPFDRQRYWPNAPKTPEVAAKSGERRPPAQWFHTHTWERMPPPVAGGTDGQRWLIQRDGGGFAERLAVALRGRGHEARVVADLTDPAVDDGTDRSSRHLVHSRYLVPSMAEEAHEDLLRVCRSLATGAVRGTLTVLTAALFSVTGRENIHPRSATALGPVLVLPQEHPAIRCRLLDLEGSEPESMAPALLAEVLPAIDADLSLAAVRGAHLWTPPWRPLPNGPQRLPDVSTLLRPGGVLLITGGLGGIGPVLAEAMARAVSDLRFILIGRHASESDPRAIGVRRRLQPLAAEVLIRRADVTDETGMMALADEITARFGGIHGVIHAAGVAGSLPIVDRDRQKAREILAVKIDGAEVLDRVFSARRLDFMIFCGSLSSVLGGIGMADYSAANAFLDAFAAWRDQARSGRTLCIAWDGWRDLGMSAASRLSADERARWQAAGPDSGIDAEEGGRLFLEILARATVDSGSRVLVSTVDLAERAARARRLLGKTAAATPAAVSPDSNPAGAGSEGLERLLSAIWCEVLGLDRVGMTDNFFELGADSYLVVQAHDLLRQRLPANGGAAAVDKLSVADFFEHANVAALAAHLKVHLEGGGAPDPVRDRAMARADRQRRAMVAEGRGKPLSSMVQNG